MKALSFEELKGLLTRQTLRECLTCALVPEGLPKGAITELSGIGKTEFVLALLSEYAEAKVAWIEESFSVFPFGFLQRQVDLSRVLFVESGRETCWCALEVLKSQTCPIVVIYADELSLNELRKIQIASERAQAITLWLTPEPKSLWPVSLQLKVARDQVGSLYTQVLRRRFS